MNLPAARRFDTIGHGYGLFAGALAVAAIAALVAAEIVTCGAVTIFVVGAAAAMIGSGVQKKLSLDDIPTGRLITGSGDVFINKRPAVHMYNFGVCAGLVLHPAPISPVMVIEGAKRVLVNKQPMARSTMRLLCGARIGSASPDVYVGGPTAKAFWGVDFLYADNIFMFLPFVAVAAEAGAVVAAVEFLGMLGLNELVLNDLHHWLDSRFGDGTGDVVFGVVLLGMSAAGMNRGGSRELPSDTSSTRGPTRETSYGGGPREGGARYEVDELGRTTTAEGRVTGPHRGRPKGMRPDPPGGRSAGDHRGHLIPEGGVDTPANVNVPENIISESPASNLGPKKTFDNLASKTAAENPHSVVTTQHQPHYSGSNTRPDAVTHTITVDGAPLHTVTIPNPPPPVNP